MAKKKKKKREPKRSLAAPLPSRLRDGLYDAQEHMRRGEWLKADALLRTLEQRYPDREEVLGMTLNVAISLKDYHTVQRCYERLLALRPNKADFVLGLAGAYLTNVRPVLALRTFRTFLERWPDHGEADRVRQKVASLESIVREQLANIGLGADDLQLALWHEEIQVHLERGELAAARQTSERLIEARPQFAPAYNNGAEACFHEGDLDAAIALSRRLLAFDPDNVHALSNLTRYLFLNGKPGEAKQLAGQLRKLTPPNREGWFKIAEALSYLGNDAGVLRVLEAAGENPSPVGETAAAAYLEHLAGVAAFRLGQLDEARQHWQRALQLQPGFHEVRANLEDLRHPVAERHAAWPFNLAHWMPRKLFEEFARRIPQRDGAKLGKAALEFLEEHPLMTAVVPALLDRGDPDGRTWALRLALLLQTPPLLEALRDFTLSQRGPDKQRTEASRAVLVAGLLPHGPVRMWIKGQWREILLLNYEISDAPDHKHSPEVAELAEQGHVALRAGNGPRAENLLRKALEREPDSPDLLNNLAAALEMQGHRGESQAMVRDIHARFPDYFFGCVSVARMEIHAGHMEKARQMLRPLLEKRRLHTSEFTALATAQIEWCLAQNEREGALSWLEMWERIVPDHPALPVWRLRLRGPSFRDLG